LIALITHGANIRQIAKRVVIETALARARARYNS
jgi:hypothetical protein